MKGKHLIAPALRVIRGLHRRCCRAEQHQRILLCAAKLRNVARVIARRIFRLVASLLLLVENDETEVRQRREHRTARAEHDAYLAAPDALPLVIALRERQRAVQHHNICAELRGKAPHHLRRQRDLRHEQHRRPAARKRLLDEPEVDLCLAACGHAVKERGTAALSLEQRGKALVGCLLLFVKRDRCVLAFDRLCGADAQHLLLGKLDKAGLFEPSQRLHRRARVVADLRGGQRPLAAEKLDDRIAHRRAAALGLDGGKRLLCADTERHHARRLVAKTLLHRRFADEKPLLLERMEDLPRFLAAQLIERRALSTLRAEHSMKQRFLERIGRDCAQRFFGADAVVQPPDLAALEPHAARQQRFERVVVGAEVPRLHPADKADIPAVQQRRVIQKGVDGLIGRLVLFVHNVEHEALAAPVAAPERNEHPFAGHGSLCQLFRDAIGVELIGRIRNRRDCDTSKHLLCHTVSSFVVFLLLCDVRVDILCGELTGSDLVDGRGDRLFAEGITLFVGLLGDLAGAARDHVDEQITVFNVLVEQAHCGIKHHNNLLPSAFSADF